MSKTAPGKKQIRSMRGKVVDMELLRKRNELTPAVGNARVNARGDELGPNGTILRKREEIVADHYATAGTADHAQAPAPEPEAVVDEPVVTAKKTKKVKAVEESRLFKYIIKGFLLNIINVSCFIIWTGVIVWFGPKVGMSPLKIWTFFVVAVATYLLVNVLKFAIVSPII